MSENIHNGHRERMRKKFIKLGFSGFESHEILEMLLFYSVPRRNTNEIAHRLINKYHSITEICNADLNELMEIDGIGETSAVLLKMIPLLSREYLFNNRNNVPLDNINSACNYFKTLFIGETTEKMRIVCLNDTLKPICGKIISEGSTDGVNITIKSIVEYTYSNKCENIMLAHTHPNGIAFPSDNDVKSTVKLFNSLKAVGINLLDHIIVAGDNAVSLKDIGAFSFTE